MRSIAIINQKGGVGKTTTAVNLSAALAQSGKRVCVIDMDPQAHASLHLGFAMGENDLSVYNVLVGDAALADVRHQAGDNLWLVPSQLDLAAVELELASEVGREIILSDRMQEDTAEFDYVILDCPPSLGILTLNALTTVHEVFLPLQPHFLALHGLSKLMKTIDIVAKRLNQQLKLTGVMFCMYETGTRLAAEVSGDVTKFLGQGTSRNCPWDDAHIFDTKIRRNIRLAEAPSYGQSIFEYSPGSPGAADYRKMADEVLAMPQAQQTAQSTSPKEATPTLAKRRMAS